MRKDQTESQHAKDQQQCLTSACHSMLQAAKQSFEKGLPPSKECPIYNEAKKAEVIERNLLKAVQLYVDAASKGEKIDSCVKDFAAVVHRMGQTSLAVKFMNQVHKYYQGEEKFENLQKILAKQTEPSGKHLYKRILLEMPDQVEPNQELMKQLFGNPSRIKNVRAFTNLAFDQPSKDKGQWLVLEFDSYSAAKKTIQSFREEEWFGVKKFWLRQYLISCLATHDSDDFQESLVLTEAIVPELFIESQMRPEREPKGKEQEMHFFNRMALRLLQRHDYLKQGYQLCAFGEQKPFTDPPKPTKDDEEDEDEDEDERLEWELIKF